MKIRIKDKTEKVRTRKLDFVGLERMIKGMPMASQVDLVEKIREIYQLGIDSIINIDGLNIYVNDKYFGKLSIFIEKYQEHS